MNDLYMLWVLATGVCLLCFLLAESKPFKVLFFLGILIGVYLMVTNPLAGLG